MMSDKAPKDQDQKGDEAMAEEFKEDLGPFVVAAETTAGVLLLLF